MGADYFIFSEINVKGKWEQMDPMVWNIADEKYECAPTYYSGSRTYFSSTYHALRNDGMPCSQEVIKTFSPRLKQTVNALYHLDDGDNSFFEEPDIGQRITIIDWADAYELISDGAYDYDGFIPVNSPQDIEEMSEENILSAKEWVKLTPSMQGNFEYKTWDDPYGWRYHLKEIRDIIEHRKDEFLNLNWMAHTANQIRLIMILDT